MKQDKNEKWRLTAEDIRINHDDMFNEDESDTITAYLETRFDVDKRFGTTAHGTDDYINLYAEFNPYEERLALFYFIHYADGKVSDSIDVRDVSDSEKKAILGVMKEAGLDDVISEMKENQAVDYISKCPCHIHSLGGEKREATIISKKGDNQYIADYNGVKCTAIFNPFVGAYYVDDVDGVIGNAEDVEW